MTVIVTDVSLSRAEAVAKEIQEAGGNAEPLTIDVSKPAELDTLASYVFDKYGSVRLLVNNAGIETLGYTWEIPLPRWEATLNINIHGVVHGCRAFIPRMLDSGEECWIANLASIGAFSVMPTQTAYIMTKHAVQSFSECLFLELKLKNAPISVSSVMPGMLKTRIFEAKAGEGEGSGGEAYRKAMHEMMSNYGMNIDEGCSKIMRGIAEKKFWVDTQAEMTNDTVEQRVKFLRERRDPEIAESARHLLDL
ncbi:short-chain dehydrogenase/reductase SDR [Zopfia rhizophila CBS 207.26]|uniref:Short-chain dehydrogenase/reductase SDR n=1 Tax=Zopfia rhizophila CBS 207.26 TaxID=1314779 RepID=A0A6A6DKU9_9PEZI|nr:short-chain dehydrogenase/reductase SDR [Zopfia rhizophila CBS 207.26]